MSLRMLPRRRLISLSPRYLLTRQCRRLSTVSVPHPWTLPCRRSHTVLSQNVSTQMGSRSASSFSVDVFVQTPSSSTVLNDVSTQRPLTEFFLDVSSRTILWTAETLFVSPRHQCKVHVPCCSRRQDSNSSLRLLILLLALTCTLHMAHLLSAIPVMPAASCLYHPSGNTSCALNCYRQKKC